MKNETQNPSDDKSMEPIPHHCAHEALSMKAILGRNEGPADIMRFHDVRGTFWMMAG